MRFTIFIAVLSFTVLSCSQNVEQESVSKSSSDSNTKEMVLDYDFNADSVGYYSPEEVARIVVNFLVHKDTARYLSAAIPLQVQKYLFQQNFEYQPNLKDQDSVIDRLTARYDERMENFLVRSKYILQIMQNDKKFRIDQAVVDTLSRTPERIKNYGGGSQYIVGNWIKVSVKMTYEGEEFFLEIPQIIELKGKWFLYYPEFYIRTKSDLKFMNERTDEFNRRMADFWF